MNYALIRDGVVSNLIWLHPANAKDFPDAVATGGLPVRIGDTYRDGAFYRDGERVISALEAELADMQAALALLGVTDDE